MDKLELLDLIVDAIEKARKESTSPLLELVPSPENGLAAFSKAHIFSELSKLGAPEKVLELVLPRRVKKYSTVDGRPLIELEAGNYDFDDEAGRVFWRVVHTDGFMPVVNRTPIPDEDLKICVELKAGFDNWLASYRLRTRDDLEQITPLTLAKVCITVLAISEKLEATSQPSLQIRAMFQATSPFLPQSFIPSEYRKDALEYMKNKGVVTWYKINFYAANGVDASLIDLTIDIPKFQQFKARVLAAYIAKEKQLAPSPTPEAAKPPLTKPESDADVVYEVKLTNAGEILINEFLLARPNFDGENESIFNYVFERPNQTIALEDLRQALDGKLPNKSLPRIVDNWGFTRELKKLFFRVSSQSIYFRNPVRKKDLDATKVGRLSLSRR